MDDAPSSEGGGGYKTSPCAASLSGAAIDCGRVDQDSTVAAIVVAYSQSPEQVVEAVNALESQSARPAEIIVIDTHPQGAIADAVESSAPAVRVIGSGANIGYAAACNLAASVATSRHLFFLNPDARAEPDCLERLLAEIDADERNAIVGAQILLPDGVTTNAGDNPLHLSGLSWAGRWGLPREHGPPRDVLVASGAALLIRRDAFAALGGYDEGFFMYYDDADLGWRANISGLRVRYVPEACVRHEYEFEKGGRKWRYLERNRYWAVFANYELTTLIALAPLLVAVELAVWAFAFRRGFAGEKARAWLSLARSGRALFDWRRRVQAMRTMPDRELLPRLTATIDSPALASPLLTAAAPLLRAYKWLVLVVAGADRRSSETGAR
jgi:GT2 family glycosyltransferase